MRLLPRAIAVLATQLALGCWLWAPPPESYALPPLEIPPPDAPEPDMSALDDYERSGLWLAKWAIGSLYLFGSSELSPEEGYASFGTVVEDAYAESQEVVHEIDLGAAEPARTLALMRRYGILERPAKLKSQLSRETWALLEERFARSGMSTAAVQSLRPWLVSYAIANRASLAGGRDPLPGIADRVQERAQLAKGNTAKPVVGLGTLEAQFQMFAALPRGVQDSLLRSALGGDYAADALLRRSPALMPQLASLSPERAELYEHLIYRRSEEMAERLSHLAIDGKLRFVEVGFLHLVGERGIPALLAQRGFRVSRLR